jgi:uncharacterized repeat protein (TIGR01451 family)
VFIAQPCIDVIKYADVDRSAIGHPVLWTIEVTNCGNVDLFGVWVNDTLVDFSQQVDVPAGQTVTISLGYIVSECDINDDDYVCNLVTVEGFYCHYKLVEEAEDCVFIMLPCVEVFKGGPEFAVAGETIYYTIDVHNCGNVDLEVVEIFDETIGYYEQIPFPLAAGGWYNVTVPFDIPVCYACDELCNIVEVEANAFANDLGHCVLYASDSHCVQILEPSIWINKIGPENAYRGETITFTFTIINDGEVNLEDVYVYDPLLEKEYYIGDLAVGASVAFTDTYTISVDFELGENGGELGNFAYAFGYFHGVETMFGDGWAVWIMPDPCPPCEDPQPPCDVVMKAE